MLPVLAWAYLELDETEQAARTIEEALRRQRAGQYRLALVDALRVQALVALRQGNVQTAVDALEEGLAPGPSRCHIRTARGGCCKFTANYTADCGEPTAAREQLEAALVHLRAARSAQGIWSRTEQLLTTLN